LIYRKATMNDVAEMMKLRKRQLIDEGIEPSVNMDDELLSFFERKLRDGTLIQWLVEDHGEVVACGAVLFYEFPPSYTNKTGKKAYIANMFTDENYRGRGIAKELLAKLVKEVRAAGISKIWLGASEMGRPVYRKFGFIESDEYLELDLAKWTVK
jgi:ribosomal protein S18 acetylase RimI-like enzyme